MKEAMITFTVVLATCALIAGLSTQAYAITGVCSNCHTMHNSQDGADLSGSPNARLLVGAGCIGCHKAGVGVQNDGTGTPYVDHTSAPTFGTNTLAGGSFYWVADSGGNDDTKGHNVYGIATQDANITAVEGAPGDGSGCATANGCHKTLADQAGGGGCTACHLDPSHHGNNSGTVTASPWYRWLSRCNNGVADTTKGVTGVEHAAWNYNATAVSHNEYKGVAGTHTTGSQLLATDSNMTAFCSGCHGGFHETNTAADGSGDWIRHPADFVIPNSGEYQYSFGSVGGGAVGTYDPDLPVGRPDITSFGNANEVRIATDMVMCLSCHVAHGSPYSDLLRWDYTTMVAGGGGSGGCFTCHTTKD